MLLVYFRNILQISIESSCVVIIMLILRAVLLKGFKINPVLVWNVIFVKFLLGGVNTEKYNIIPQKVLDFSYAVSHFESTDLSVNLPTAEEFYTMPAPSQTVDIMQLLSAVWICGIIVLVLYNAVALIKLKLSVKDSELLRDNIYISKNINTAFVWGIIDAKIYLPSELTQAQQQYVITHEQQHIKLCDHNTKWFRMLVSVIHWFNPLVWLSFYIMEKDMEMYCDENVIDTLGAEHKKGYSQCLLELAQNVKFVPKAYTSFGESEVKSRIKNIISYKKPKDWMFKAVNTVCMLIFISVTAYSATSVNSSVLFPAYDQRTEFNGKIFDIESFKVAMTLPDGWEIHRTDDEKYPLSGVWNKMGIYNEKGFLIGAIGYNIIDDPSYTEPRAIYNQIALGNHYQFAVNSIDYKEIDKNSRYTIATVPVYTSATFAAENGWGNREIINYGIVCHSTKYGVYIAMELDNSIDGNTLAQIARSIRLNR